MAHSENIKEIINQVAMQAAATVIIAFRDTEMGLWSTTAQN